MKLLRCHIDNFGKLTDYTVDFAENPQVFYAPNGWGKSTLAAFIKVMFYGFSGETKRGVSLEKERLRYKPWQGGVYGGEIWFEACGRKYLLNRTFGSKEAEDTFALYDGTTNLKSEDYTTNIGEELFQINQESFLRTVFLAQNDCGTFATDSINAKIGNLADNLDDMNNYEKVQQELKDLRNAMSPSRKTGSLKKQKEAIARLKDSLRKTEVIEAAVRELEDKVTGCSDRLEHLAVERKEVQSRWEILTRQKAVEAKKNHYESIVKQCQEKQAAVDERLAVMGGRVPDQDELLAMQGQYRLLQAQESVAGANILQDTESLELNRLQQRFQEGVPQTEALKFGRECLNRLEELRLEVARKCLDEGEKAEKKRLEEKLSAWDGSMEDLENTLDESLHCINAYMEQKNGLGAKKATFSSLRMMEEKQQQEDLAKQKKASVAALCAFIAGAALLVAGGILFAVDRQTAGMAALCGGAVAVIAGMVLKVSRKPQNSAQVKSGADILEQEIVRDEAWMADNREYVENVLTQLEGTGGNARLQEGIWEDPLRIRDTLYDFKDLVKDLQKLRAKELDYQAKGYEAQMADLQGQVTAVLEPFCEEICANRMGELLDGLSKDKDRFTVLSDRAEKYRTANAEADSYRRQLIAYVAQYGQNADDLYESLQKLVSSLNDYKNDKQQLSKLESEKQDFEANHDMKTLEQGMEDVTDSEDELKERMEELDEELSLTGEQIHGYKRQLEERQAELEELSWQREQLALAEAEHERDKVYYDRLGYVSTYLEKAKESLSAKYVGPVMESFKRGYEVLSGESGEDFRMDANIHVTKRALGEQRETGAFSAGNQDLIHIVLRVALVEAMYQKEKPFLVIDDSFVNLDGEKLSMAGNYLKEISKDYQVIYFTCHESRVFADEWMELRNE